MAESTGIMRAYTLCYRISRSVNEMTDKPRPLKSNEYAVTGYKPTENNFGTPSQHGVKLMIREYIAEKFLWWALRLLPVNERSLPLIKAIMEYAKETISELS
jgi:hypothetical protein